MMQARVLDIYAKYGEYIKAIVPLKIEDEYMKIIIYLLDDTNLRVTEEWDCDKIKITLADLLSKKGDRHGDPGPGKS
jgi:hypothetical protein